MNGVKTMSKMTYKQAIKILSEAKVADIPMKGAGSNHKMYDIARRMAIEALKEKEAAEQYEASVKGATIEPKVKIGDTIYVLTTDVPDEIEVTQVKSIKRVIVDDKETFRYNAQCVLNGRGSGMTWTFYDKDFGVNFFTQPQDAMNARKNLNATSDMPCKVGDIIPFKTRTGYVINYIVEKIKVREDGSVKIRCKHGGIGQARSFTVGEARTLIRTGGLYYC